MALSVSNAASAHINGVTALSPAEDEELYSQLLQLQDVVIAGKHPVFKLPRSAIEQLKATLIVPDAAGVNGTAFATNQQQLQSPPAKVNALPGLNARAPPTANGATSAYAAKAAGLDPIFLQKSDSLVRAEGQLKRQRIERDLQTQVEQRRHTARDRDPGAEDPSRIDINAVLNTALSRVAPISGLRPAKAASVSSFDENDYYSSQAPSDWSSDTSSSKGSDKAAGAFTADFERLDAAPDTFAESSRSAQKRALPGSSLPQAPKDRPHFYANEPEDVYGIGDEDDEYTPPDAATFDSSRGGAMVMDAQDNEAMEDDNSDYEPGEITQESAIPTPYYQFKQPTQPSPRVPVIRNHLTHIAAPQPNRVSPLATAKGPSIELELVNGRPEVVHKPQPQHRSAPMHSRASTASPAANGAGSSGKKKRPKKRKREQMQHDHNKPAKRGRRDRQAARAASPVQQEPYIKDEPTSPPPFANVPEAPAYGQQQYRAAPAPVDLISPGHAPQMQNLNEHPRSALRYEYAQPASPAAVRVASPAAYRPAQRDTQDLRRVAVQQYAQRAPSPPAQRVYSPADPYRGAEAIEAPRYQDSPVQQQQVQYVHAPSPPRLQEYQEPYARAQSPAMMPPPPPKRIVVDQYGNRYYAHEPAPAPTPARASVAPVVERRTEQSVYERAREQTVYERAPEQQPVYERALEQPVYERASSRMSVAYSQPQQGRYEAAESRMAPLPPPLSRRYEPQPVEYVDANGYRVVREYSTRPAEPTRYAEEPTSPVYQQQPRYEPVPPPPAPAELTSPVYREVPRYEQMPPPPPPQAREPTSPIYQQLARAYSVRPEEPPQAGPGYVRQTSVAPVQYVRQDMGPPPPPARAVSVMPGSEYPTHAQQPSYSYAPAPQAVKYVDQYGREVFPQQVRQVSEFRYQ